MKFDNVNTAILFSSLLYECVVSAKFMLLI